MSQALPLVPIGQVAHKARIDKTTYRRAIADGLITVAPERMGPGRGGGLAITQQDADLIIAVATAAVLIGVAFMTLLRIARAAGATVTDGALNFGSVPIPALSKTA